MLVVNSLAYASFEAANLQNVEFFYGDGTVIPSWLESGNSNSATNTIYWLKLGSSIPAGSSVTVYMGFAAPTTNKFDAKNVGEAPQLSAQYGQYDNGRNVFLFYDNFAGSSLSSSWTTNIPAGSYLVANGLALGYPLGYVATLTTYGAGTTFDTYVTGVGDVNNIGFFNLAKPLSLDFGAYEGAFIRTACGNTYPEQWNDFGEASGCGNSDYFVQQEGVAGVYSVNLIPSASSFQYLNYAVGIGGQPITSFGPGYPLSAGFVSGHGNPVMVQWARIRASPPDAMMPGVVFGIIKCPGQTGVPGVVCPLG
jgi:hypothetical protein